MEFVNSCVFKQKYNFESELINLKEYFDEYSKLLYQLDKCLNEKCKTVHGLGCCEENCNNDSFYLNFLGISRDELKELKERTSIDLLTCENEIQPFVHEFHKKFNKELLMPKTEKKCDDDPENTLNTVRYRKKMSESGGRPPSHYFKYNNYTWTVSKDKVTKSKFQFESPDLSTVVACVKIYHPFLSLRYKTMKIKLLQEIHILGNQTLSELRDKITCSLDHISGKDLSCEIHLKEVGVNFTAKHEYPSSFIFIENIFYNDTRDSNMIDLSKELREWADKKNLGPFETANMKNVRICDLKLKLGRPYVFQHQGNCEHLIVFSDIRFLELSDRYKLTSYPRIHCFGRLYGKHCMMCTDSYAKWMVVNSNRLTHDKAYLCKKCFISYNYINGIKIGNFEAYKYVDHVALL